MPTSYDADYFLRGADMHRSLYSNYRWIPELTLPLAHRIIEGLGIQTGDTVLDFGCARGYLVRALRLLGIRADGVDISTWAIENADAEVKEFVRQGSAEEAGGPYDFIFAKDVLEHIEEEDLAPLLRRLREIGSQLLVVVPLGEDGSYRVGAYHFDSTHMICETLHWWESRLEEAGWNVLEACYSWHGVKDALLEHYPEGNGVLHAD